MGPYRISARPVEPRLPPAKSDVPFTAIVSAVISGLFAISFVFSVVMFATGGTRELHLTSFICCGIGMLVFAGFARLCAGYP